MTTNQRPALGRPRAFDVDQALDRAMQVFWHQGYEGASLSDLTGAMGITRTSMYAAYGNKADLFRKALQRYTAGPAGYVYEALKEPTARTVAERILQGAACATTLPGRPAGCLGVQGALAVGESGRSANEALIRWRRDGEDAIRERFVRARAEGDLPPDADPAALARYLLTFAYGISVQAATGVPRDELLQVAQSALRAWPAT
ncbi:TetR/AcrR family transcriptional regulator [Streptomyces sp. R41]|uniref:TetR/AcrR family transcriptional regulator n=1 Tax=Streptomyces sp. R41 TaxID=3238632 RepID=A0AB39R931_9ACTN